jgi:hypothetical protein
MVTIACTAAGNELRQIDADASNQETPAELRHPPEAAVINHSLHDGSIKALTAAGISCGSKVKIVFISDEKLVAP